MSYTNPSGTSDYTLNTGTNDLYVFESATGSTYTPEPYAKKLSISANDQTFDNLVISNGGVVINSKTTIKNQLNTFRNVDIHNGGLLSGMTGAVLSNATVHSGGSFVNAGFTLKGVTVSSGATIAELFTGATVIYGDTIVASGAKVLSGTYDLKAYTDADGWWHNMKVYGAVHLRAGAKALDPVINSWLYMSAGVTVSGGTIGSKGKGGMIVYNGAAAVDFTLTSGVLFDINYSGATLGGTQANLNATPIYICNGKFTSAAADRDPNLTITNGVINGMTLVDNGTNHLRQITLINGIVASAPQVSAGGELILASGGIARNAEVGGSVTVWLDGKFSGGVVRSGGSLKITSGGELYGGTIASGGSLTVHNRTLDSKGAYASGTVVESGGYLLTSQFGVVENIQVSSGATFDIRAHVTFKGNATNVAQGTFYVPALGGYRETLRVENGVMLGLNDETMAIHIRDDFKISGGEFKGYIHVSNGGYVNGVTFKMNGANAGGFLASEGGVIENAVVSSGGDVRMYKGLVSGATFSSGATLKFYTTGGTVRGGLIESGAARIEMTDASVIDGVEVRNNVIVRSGAEFVNNRVLGAGAYVSAAKGAFVSGVVISRATGTVFGFYDANAEGVSQGRAAMIARDIDFQAGTAILRGSNVYGDDLRVSAGAVHLQNGGHFTNVTVRGGEVLCYANNTEGAIGAIPVEAKTDMHIDGVTVSGGLFSVNSFGNASNVTVYGGEVTVKNRNVYGSGGYMTKLIQSGGSVNISAGGLLESASLFDDAELNITDNAVATSITATSGATVYISGGAVAEHLIFTSSAFVYVSGATVRDVDIQFISGGSVKMYKDAVASNVTVSATKKDLNALLLYDNAVASNVHLKYAYVYCYGGGFVSGGVCSNGAMIARGGGLYNDITVLGGQLTMQNGGSAYNIVVSGGIAEAGDRPSLTPKPIATPAYIEGIDLVNGTVRASSGGVLSSVRASGGTVNMISGAAFDVTVLNGAKLLLSSGGQVTNADVRAGGRLQFTKDGAEATIMGGKTNIAAGAMYYNTTALTASIENGVLTGFNPGTEFKLSIGDDILVKDVELNNGEIRISCFDGASVDGALVSAGAIICNAGANGTMDNVTLVNAGIMNLSGTAKANNTVVLSGGQLAFHAADASAENTTVMANGKLVLKVAANTGNRLTLAFDGAGAGTETKIDYLGRIAGSTTVVVTGAEQAVGTYYLGSGGALYDSATCGTLSGVTQKWGLYENAIAANGSYDDALNGVTYSFNGTAITTTALTIATGEAAGLSGDNYTALRTNDRAAKWTGATADATLVTENFAGDAWLEVAGNADKAIYGASVDFANTVNINAKSGTINNLAAGAAAGKTVGAVKLTFDGANLGGTGYAGGFGNVTGETETLIADGTFSKDFYAGALANYAKTGAVTSTGDISLDIDAGTFSGNIYGAAAVKAGEATSVVHSVGNVTINVKGGSTTKGGQACLFAGGYATGTTTDKVYEVTSVSTTISGGNWGSAAGGRGVFGGVFASKVTAEAGDVSITINGGTMGNVYGGGWAQKGGNSIVGDVSITINGGTVTNVFGGGSHSTSGGTTEAGAVTITVAGGTINGDIYARGQSENDSVASAAVIFTGATDFGCGVYGYTYVGGEDPSAATLSYTGYTGTFSGEIGGFGGITFASDTAMTLTTAAVYVNNSEWEFDLSARDEALSDTSLLTWGAEAGFSGDTVKVSFADETQAKAGWSIADAAFTGATFTLAIGDAEIGSAAYGEAISGTGTAYDGWGFALEESTLKFKQLA